MASEKIEEEQEDFKKNKSEITLGNPKHKEKIN